MVKRNTRMSKKIKFVVPTLFARKQSESACIERLCEQVLLYNPECEVHVVCNYDNPAFLNWTPKNAHIQKHVSHLMHNISKAINVVAQQSSTPDFDYFCFVQSDITFENEDWIQKCIDVYETHGNVGVIGIRPHSTFGQYNKPITDIKIDAIDKMYEVLWSDGIMFFSTKLFDKIGYFDEQYSGDCESQDFCFKAFDQGFVNIYIPDKYLKSVHDPVPFANKSPKSESLMSGVKQARHIFDSKWKHVFKKIEKAKQ